MMNNRIWKRNVTCDELNNHPGESLAKHLGIKCTEIGEDYLTGTMMVDARTHQPMGILHGGASCVLAETLGSVAGNLCLELGYFAVGLEINANHLKSVRAGLVKGVARPIHLGRSTQVWDIRLFDSEEKLFCISRLTLSVLAIEGKV